MKPFCDIIVSDVLPAMRALLAKELMHTYGLNQSETSKKLGITQPAISQYMRELRGNRVKILESNKKINRMIKKLAESIAKGKIKTAEANEKFCDICVVVRKEKLICKTHIASYPSMKSCTICLK